MAMYFQKEDKQRLTEEVTIRQVVDYLGIETRRTGSHLSILCPSPDHNDKHFGSCKIINNRCYCYACGKSINAINILMWQGGLSYYDAMCVMADLSGHACDFEASNQEIPDKPKQIKLTTEEKRLIGLSTFPRAKVPIRISYKKPEKNSFIRNDDGYLIYSGMGYNPWSEMIQMEPEILEWIIKNKCKEKMECIQRLVDILRYYPLIVEDFLKGTSMTVSEIKEAMLCTYDKIKNIYLKYDEKIEDKTICNDVKETFLSFINQEQIA